MGAVKKEDLADLIVRLRGDMTQEAFAELVGISSSLIGHVEVRRRNLGLGSIEKIVTALGLNETERQRLRQAREAYAKKVSRRGGGPGQWTPLARHEELALTVQDLVAQVQAMGAAIDRLEAGGRRGAR